MESGVQMRSKGTFMPLPDLIDETDLLDSIGFCDLPATLSSFFCLICDEQHPSEDQIRSHYTSHLIDKSFECPDCATIIEDLDLFLEHVDNCGPLPDLGQNGSIYKFTNELKPLSEVQVQEKQNDSDYESHLSSNSNINATISDETNGEEYQCVLCVKIFHSKEEYKNHIQEHGPVFDDLKLKSKRGRKERPFKCELCSNCFSSSTSLHIHKQKIHLGLNFELEGNENRQNQPEQTVDGPFVCALCQSRYERKRDLKKHILSTHSVVPFQCKYCLKLFDIETRMLKHVQKHEGPSPIPCSTCNIPFASVIELEKHKKTVHTPNKSHKCKECGKCFTKSNDLLKHTRIHLNIRPYSCSICSKSFTHQTSLRNHQAVHSGLKPFICSYCGASFSYAGNLKVHIRSHTNEKPFECHVCNKTFARTANLNEHLRTHTQEKPHKCTFCGKQFTSSSTLSKHKKTHSGIKKHECGVCKKRFTEMAHLSKHVRIHTGEKPYKCSVCLKDFRRSDTLKVHFKTHLKPRKGDYGDVPPPFTIQVPLEQATSIEVQYQPENAQMENISYIPTQIVQTDSIQDIQQNIQVPYEVLTLQDISYPSDLLQQDFQVNNQPNMNYSYWTPSNFNLNALGSGTTSTQMM
uniref:CSON000077 protein n=1 Tax=Culicoides sonorensis TaxID=179676 RepID=A0A336LU99_CULSO